MKVFTAGVFDLFHYGHARLIETAYDITNGNWVNVFLNTDEFVASYKEKPIMSYQERYEVIRSNKYVLDIFPNDGKSFPKLLKKHKPDVLIVGSDWASKDYYKQMCMSRKDFEKLGIHLIYVPYTEGISSTILKEGVYDRVLQSKQNQNRS